MRTRFTVPSSTQRRRIFSEGALTPRLDTGGYLPQYSDQSRRCVLRKVRGIPKADGIRPNDLFSFSGRDDLAEQPDIFADTSRTSWEGIVNPEPAC